MGEYLQSHVLEGYRRTVIKLQIIRSAGIAHGGYSRIIKIISVSSINTVSELFFSKVVKEDPHNLICESFIIKADKPLKIFLKYGYALGNKKTAVVVLALLGLLGVLALVDLGFFALIFTSAGK